MKRHIKALRVDGKYLILRETTTDGKIIHHVSSLHNTEYELLVNIGRIKEEPDDVIIWESALDRNMQLLGRASIQEVD